MRVKSMLTVGFLSIMAATGVVNASDDVAAGVHRVDVIESPQETITQEDSVKAGSQQRRVDVIERIESGGPVYPYTKPMSH
jgi:hypothetical protein